MKKLARTFLMFSILSLLHVMPVQAADDIPQAAKERFKAGLVLIEKAEKPGDFLAALAEFETAAALAPQWPDIHYNLAKLATETDKPAKAIKEYRTYLTLVPAADDRAAVEGEIDSLKEHIARKRKIGIPGVKFAAMADGIALLEIFPGSRIAKTDLQKGDKIISVDPPQLNYHDGRAFKPAKEKSPAVNSLADFFRAIENTSWHSDDEIKQALTEVAFEKNKRGASAGNRMFSRVSGRDTEESGPVLVLTVIRGGQKMVRLIKKSMFQSNIIEIEEEEFEAEVLRDSLPVAVTFWTSWCEPCREFTPIMEAESTKYSGKIKFVNINMDENKKLAKQLQIKGVPTLMVFRGDSAVSNNTGRLDKDRVAEILNSVIAR